MRDDTSDLLGIRAQLNSIVEAIDRLALADPDTPRSADDREIVAVTAMLVTTYGPRTRADILRFVRAVKAGDEGWLLLHSVPAERRVDAAYFSQLPREARGLVR